MYTRLAWKTIISQKYLQRYLHKYLEKYLQKYQIPDQGTQHIQYLQKYLLKQKYVYCSVFIKRMLINYLSSKGWTQTLMTQPNSLAGR